MRSLYTDPYYGVGPDETNPKGHMGYYKQYKYIIDPHTAVGKWVYEYREERRIPKQFEGITGPQFPGDVKAIKDMEYTSKMISGTGGFGVSG